MCLGWEEVRTRSDVAFAQEWTQVLDAKLVGLVAFHLHEQSSKDVNCSRLSYHVRAAVASLESLSFASISVVRLVAGSGNTNNKTSASSSSCLLAPSFSRLEVRDVKMHQLQAATTSTVDVFWLIGNTFVPPHTSIGTQLNVYQLLEMGGDKAESERGNVLHHHRKQPLASYDVLLFASQAMRDEFFTTMARKPTRFSPFASARSGGAFLPPHLHVLPPPLHQALTLDDTSLLHKAQARIVVDGVLSSSFARFVKANVALLRNTFRRQQKQHEWQKQRQEGTKKNKPYLALIIEPRVHFAFEFVVKNVMLHLDTSLWSLQVYHSTGLLGNEDYVRMVLSDVSYAQFVSLPEPFNTAGHYNQLLKGAPFWSSLATQGFEKVLIFQTDSLMLGHHINDFLAYDFIGAPFHRQASAPSADWLVKKNKQGVLVQGVGNGGLSLRSVRAMLKIANTYVSKNQNVNEDLFFIQYIEKDATLSIAPRQVAYAFAQEVPCDDLAPLSKPPLGIHNAWSYVNKSEAMWLLQKSMPMTTTN